MTDSAPEPATTGPASQGLTQAEAQQRLATEGYNEFPPANTPLFYFNDKAAQGTRIHETSADLAVIVDWLPQRPDVVAITTTAGQSLTRFILTYPPAKPDPSQGRILIRATDFAAIPALSDDLTAYAAALPWAETRVEQIICGPPVTADVEARFFTGWTRTCCAILAIRHWQS